MIKENGGHPRKWCYPPLFFRGVGGGGSSKSIGPGKNESPHDFLSIGRVDIQFGEKYPPEQINNYNRLTITQIKKIRNNK